MPVPADRVIDGVNLLPYALGAKQGRPHEDLFWRSGVYQVVRSGDWKLQVNPTRGKVWLYDLATDPTEQHDLAAAQPERVKQLQAKLATFNSEQAESLWPSLLEAPILIDKPLNRPQTADDEYIYWSN